jgi:hypothetical protein
VVLVGLHAVEVATLALREAVLTVELELGDLHGVLAGALDTRVEDNLGEEVVGGLGEDIVTGDGGLADLLFGGSDNDEVSGGDGLDMAFGGSGQDMVSGDAGIDLVFGNSDNDDVLGGGDELLGQPAVCDHDQSDHRKHSRSFQQTMVRTRLFRGQ